MTTFDSLLCTEVMEPRTPEGQKSSQSCREQSPDHHNLAPYPELPPTVRAVQDQCQVNDHRILQNLLRNQDKYLPPVPDYVNTVQQGKITAKMRKIVAEWMLDVVHEQNSQPEVFSLAMNIMDRFLCTCAISKSQLQLLGSVCLLISSKIREPCSIPGKTLIAYTDNSITADEIKEWELLVLHKLQWELTAVTAMDYLDHTIPRLALPSEFNVSKNSLTELRRRAETILVICATDYSFSYVSQSCLATAAILVATFSLSTFDSQTLREVKLGLQTVTHTATDHLDRCAKSVNDILPPYLRVNFSPLPLPDSTSLDEAMATPTKDTSGSTLCSSSSSPGDASDLICNEVLPSDSIIEEHFEQAKTTLLESPGYSRSSSPLSAVDIFTEYNTNILQALYEQADNNMDSSFSHILVN